MLDGDTLIAVSGAGNGWGKSEVIAAIFAAAIWPNLASPALALPIFQNWKHPKRARIYSTPAELDEIGSLQTAIARWFPKGKYTSSKGRYNYPSVFVTDTGWVLDMFSYERPAKEAAGPNIGLQALNEPPPEALYREAIARSRAGGVIIGGMTSLKDEPWIVDGLLSKHDGKTIKVRYGNSCENCIEHGKNGHLKHERIMAILDQYDPDEKEARFSGRPLSLSGRIYKAFDRNVHVAKEPIIPPSGGVSFYQAVDPAIGKPVASIWAYVGRDGVVHIYDEHPETNFHGAKDSNLTVKDYISIWTARENGKQVNRIIDRHFGNVRRTLGGLSLRQEFSQAGLSFRDSYTMDAGVEVETGILKVKELLRYDTTKERDSLNTPKIVISPTCKNVIASFERWGRNPDTGKPKEEYKDFMDCVRYLAMANPVYEIPSNWTPGTQGGYGVNV